MLDRNTFVVKEQAKLLSSKKTYDILDESGQAIGTARQKTGLLASLVGSFTGGPPTTIEFRKKPGDALEFSVRRRGYLLKKVEAVDAAGVVVGSYKAKRFSLAGGFHVYDKDGKHLADIQGKMLKSDYKFVPPGGGPEMGTVSKKWAGMVKELFTSADTYAVQVGPAYVAQPGVKMLILGAAVAIDTLFAKAVSGGGGGGGDD